MGDFNYPDTDWDAMVNNVYLVLRWIVILFLESVELRQLF